MYKIISKFENSSVIISHTEYFVDCTVFILGYINFIELLFRLSITMFLEEKNKKEFSCIRDLCSCCALRFEQVFVIIKIYEDLNY